MENKTSQKTILAALDKAGATYWYYDDAGAVVTESGTCNASDFPADLVCDDLLPAEGEFLVLFAAPKDDEDVAAIKARMGLYTGQ